MTSQSSNRSNRLTADYYHATADVIGIFWQFHRSRIREGNIPFAAMPQTENSDMTIPFDPAISLRDGNYRRPIEGFSVAVIGTMNSSLTQFLHGNNIPLTQGLRIPYQERGLQYWPPNLAEPNDSSKRFFDPFVTEKIRIASKLYQLSLYRHEDDDNVAWRNSKFGARIVTGEQTGVKITTQLSALFEQEFRKTMPLAMASISLSNLLPTSTDEIGLGDGIPSYPLLDNTRLGLDERRLQELGRGDSLGCPAGMRVSGDTEAFLRQRVAVLPPTMLHDFTTIVPDQFDRSVGRWFRGLSRSERMQIHSDELSILKGEARRSALELRETNGCPYGHGKER